MSKKLSAAGIFCSLGARKIFCWMSDRTYIKILFFLSGRGQRLNLEAPRTFNEKLQWLKLYDRNPEYIRMVDKYAVKKYVADKIGEEYIIPTLGVWDSFDEIDFESLPDQFVLKCTHDSGSTVVCKSKAEFDYKAARKKINKLLKRNYYWTGREWPYKNVKPRILAETYIEDKTSGHGLRDYKIFVFDGKAEFFYVTSDRGLGSGTRIDLYDLELNKLPCKWGYECSDYAFVPPAGFDDMIRLAERLGEGIPQVRVDMYNIEGQIFFGEMTFFPWAGMMPFEPEEWDLRFGRLIRLPESHNF